MGLNYSVKRLRGPQSDPHEVSENPSLEAIHAFHEDRFATTWRLRRDEEGLFHLSLSIDDECSFAVLKS